MVRKMCACAIHTNNLNLDIDLDESLGKRVYVNKTRVDSAGETTELGDESDISLIHRLVWVWATETSWNGSEGAEAGTEGVDHRSVPSMRLDFLCIWLDNLSIRRL